MTTILDGRKLAQRIQEELKAKVEKLHERKPGLAFILVGSNAASLSYVGMKKKACTYVGIHSFVIHLPADTSEYSLLEEIAKCNSDPLIDGILVQMPLPPHIHTPRITLCIDPDKDVDGFHPINMGKLLLGYEDGFIPCTPNGIHTLLQKNNLSVEGKHAVIIGRSNIVGKPLAAILMQKKSGCNATVTVAHAATRNLQEITRTADLLVAALGQPKFVTKDMVKPGAIVIDVGINKIYDAEGRPTILGDVDFEQVAPLASHITPVPGGIGPMTIAMLLKNTWDSFVNRRS